MGHVFRPGVTACDPGGSLVLLDLANDRYFALGGAARDACLRLVEGRPIASEVAHIVDRLVDSDILRIVAGDAKPQLCRRPMPVHIGLRNDALSPVRVGAIAAALGRHILAHIELKALPLEHVLARVVRAKRRLGSVSRPTSSPAECAAAFSHADRILTSLNRCLPRSIALARAMIAGGLVPDLILGVKLRPFEAHCWVQHGDSLVSDDPGTIVPFTPILVI
jgi:Transglutaminase-like superfamily